MPLFGSAKHKKSSQVLADCDSNVAYSRKSLTSTISSSVKSLFSKRAHEKPSYPLDLSQMHFTQPPEVMPKTSKAAKRHSAMAGPNVIRHKISTHSLNAEEYTVQELSERYSQARARVLAETARRLQSARSPSPVTPSSISTGKTLPCFPEEDEYEDMDQTSEPAELRTHVRASIPCFSSVSGLASSASSSRTCTTLSRPVSFVELDSACSSPVAEKHPQSPSNSSRETLLADQPNSPTRNSTSGPAYPVRSKKQSWETKRHALSGAGQRYSVAMSQNMNRRFQTRLTHEYEQRIYCLHAHYADVIERMETRAHNDMDRLQSLQKEVDDLRQANAALKMREAELKCQNTASARTLSGPGEAIHVPKRLLEFVEHYQEEIQRLSRETATAQEWVITLAELVIGPKKERQSWDEWLNLCLDTLQKHREQQKEQEWLKKIGWRSTIQVTTVRN
ncbi:hypothetical protein GGH12_004111 [Coemansia sp. RSA 1822]|nr:hypothetical protein LPJ76_003863 [Coemansia sp. RSA 638]KAJ2125750.1 hypothetical protein IW147_000521 [Coemansia sp. RSA 720]KAJ2541212.1 hypothetical protein GGF49_003847 [Coemansia sp. RSA 1853]KAJ2561290.1 hypothetical protein GGH12_004111 [Coemansia sp. RSA 1822]